MGSIKRNFGFLFALLMFLLVGLLLPGILMRILEAPYIYTDVNAIPKTNVGLVLGASVVHGKPSPALEARTEEGAILYKAGKVDTLLATGAVEPGYDEITPMRKYLLEAGVPTSSIATDMKGFDTYSSIYRAHNVYLADSLIIVSQDFHLPRALFIARTMHINAYGIVAPHGGRLYDYLREIPASWKAFFNLIAGRVPDDSRTLQPFFLGSND
jgi:SanA protein